MVTISKKTELGIGSDDIPEIMNDDIYSGLWTIQIPVNTNLLRLRPSESEHTLFVPLRVKQYTADIPYEADRTAHLISVTVFGGDEMSCAFWMEPLSKSSDFVSVCLRSEDRKHILGEDGLKITFKHANDNGS